MKNSEKDTSKWENASDKVSFDAVYSDFQKLKRNYRNSFHGDMCDEIDRYFQQGAKIIEVWWQYGVSLLLQNVWFEKTLLDIDAWALEKARLLAQYESQKVHIIHGDMYDMNSIPNETYDIVFNAWVLEHFNFEERVLLLKEYARILKRGGVMVIAIPNHYSKWYRIWYMIHIFFWQWKIPEEYKIYDMWDEVHVNKLELVSRKVVSPETIINFYSWAFFGVWKIGAIIMSITHKFYTLDWYLTILTIKKP